MNINSTITWIEWLPSGDETIAGTIGKLLVAIVDRQPQKRLPPFIVLLDILGRGQLGGGMGGGLLWDPITIDRTTYESFKATRPTDQLVEACGATRLEHWQAWCAAQDSGIPLIPHLALLDQLRTADIDSENGSELEALKYIDKMNEYFSFIANKRNSG